MNIPASIKGFNIPAPTFPYIEGLPLYPFAAALFAALQERATYSDRPLRWTYPSPELGRGFCNVQSHTHDHFLILEEFDDELAGVCGWYQNQYDPNFNTSANAPWTFNKLLAKALELLGLEPKDGIARLSNYNYGTTLAAWAVQRAVMVSLLKVAKKYGTNFYTLHTVYEGYKSLYGKPYAKNGEEAYAQALQNISQNQYTGGDLFSYISFSKSEGQEMEGGSSWGCTSHQTTQVALNPPEQQAYLLECPCTGIFYVSPYDYFYDFGTGLVEGTNVMPLTFDENGIFFRQTYPAALPAEYTNKRYGYRIYLVYNFNISKMFQYDMTWDEPQDNQEN